jgi:hypothetical protein
LGFTEIPVVKTEMTPEQMRIATLRHNRARGSEDVELSAQVLRDLEQLGALDWAQDSLMLDDVELQRLMDDIPAPEALADEEHSESWEPDKSGGNEELSTEAKTSEAPSGAWTSASSSQAVERKRKLEADLAAARTEEQRSMIRKDAQRDFHRVSLIFHGDESKLIKKVLGNRPAEVLIAMCAAADEEFKAKLDEGWVAIEQVLGSRTMPAEAAKQLEQAVAKAQQRGDLSEKNAWQILEYLAADYNAGPD